MKNKINVGKIKRVPLREVWKNEAHDFTSWLFNNLEILGEEMNIKLVPIEKEGKAGSFSVDIVAEDEMGQKTVIENQLEKTNHDHLGKIITYLSNLDAKIAIWISSDPKQEHERAIDWLN
jgi:RecB family endonuclease NucS